MLIHVLPPYFFFNLHHPLPRGYHLHCAPCPGLTILSRCSVADTAFLDASPSAVGRNRPPSPPLGYPTSRNLGSSTGYVDRGVAQVRPSRMPRSALPGEVRHNSVCFPSEQPRGSLCYSKGCQLLHGWAFTCWDTAAASTGVKATRTAY